MICYSTWIMLAYPITLSNRIFIALSSLLKCVFCLLQNCARYTSNAIGHCIVYFVFDMLISLRLKIQSLSLLWSSCENFRSLAEAKCHTVWKMIVYLYLIYSPPFHHHGCEEAIHDSNTENHLHVLVFRSVTIGVAR